MQKVPELKILTDDQLKARDDMAKYLRYRLELLTSQKIDKLIKSLSEGESEPFEEIRWEWTVVIRDTELNVLKELARIVRGEEK